MSFYTRAAFALLIYIFATPPADAESDHESFDRSSAIRYALERNADLRAARLAVAQAEARLDRSGRLDNPTLKLDYASDQLYNDEGESTFGVGISQSFPLARRLKKQKEVSRVDVARARMEVRQFERQLANEICEFALDIQVLEERMSLASRLVDKAAQLFAFTRERSQTGELSLLVANQAELELEVAKQELAHLEMEREKSIHRLAPLLGRRSAEHIAFKSSGPIVPDEAPPGFDPAVLERHPEFQLAVLSERAAEAEAALARADNWENVTASLFWENERGVDQPAGLGTDRFVGVGISIPIPLRKHGDLKAREKLVDRDRSRLEAAAIKLAVENEIEHALHETVQFRQRIESYQSEVLALAQSQLSQVRDAQQRGQLSYRELLQAELQTLRLEEQRIHLLESYAEARLELELARVDLPELNPSLQP